MSVKGVETAVKLTECAIILHNFLEIEGEKWEETDVCDNGEADEVQMVDLENDTDRTQKFLGQQKRNKMLDHFFPK